MNIPPAYRAAAEMTDELVLRARSSRPRFRFPRTPLIASTADVGESLAENDAARALLALLLLETRRRNLDDFPTVMMLRAALELNGIPIRFVALKELGLELVSKNMAKA